MSDRDAFRAEQRVPCGLRPLTADESDQAKALLREWLTAVRLRKSAGIPDDQPTTAEVAARTAFFDYIEEIDRGE